LQKPQLNSMVVRLLFFMKPGGQEMPEK